MTQVILWGATALFFLRIVAQLIQTTVPLGFLPPFAQFHGNVLPYPALLLAQVIILAFMVRLNLRVRSGWWPSFTVRNWLRALGIIYFLAMLFRLCAGLFGWIDHEWFRRPVPAFFHLVLATYVLTLGSIYQSSTRKVAR